MRYVTLNFGGHSTLEYKLISPIPKVDRLAENVPNLPHGRPDNIANTITSDQSKYHFLSNFSCLFN